MLGQFVSIGGGRVGRAGGGSAAGRRRAWRDFLPLTALTVVVLTGAGLWFADVRQGANGCWAAAALVTVMVTPRWLIQS
ncbi:hypothetical protein Pen02_80450 [Plantactinospora endophytica]|uniref:Uncharacterized protein n=1 Tax=Plantactinospora endophytica TaxID=673535 RepID=A0ABQ4EEL9_9ACTN|nr:hypothetical protein Pen02_80450 [Plantactinospora endophytica]